MHHGLRLIRLGGADIIRHLILELWTQTIMMEVSGDDKGGWEDPC